MFNWHIALIIVTFYSYVTPVYVINRENNGQLKDYKPTWESLDARPLPSWYDEAKIGIFIHWGVFSVPSFNSEWFWIDWSNEAGNGSITDFMRKNYPPGFTYQDFARDFTTEFYDPDQWAGLFKESGAKYIVLTSKHHEGYTLWPSKYSFGWNSVDVGPHRNLLGDLAASIRNHTDLHFGLYHSLFEWFNPLYLFDKSNGFKTDDFVTRKTIPELYELVNDYKPDVIWSDGDWEIEDSYWGSKEFLTWLYNDSPVKDTVVVNDRWGRGTGCAHGGFFNCADRFSPGELQPHKWENALTIDRESWGYRRTATLDQYLGIEELIHEIVKTVSCGGNVLVNVGPTKEGTITPIFEERLRQMGKWLNVNGKAIYGTVPWTFQNDTIVPDIWYTKKDSYVYAISLIWPKNGELKLTSPKLSTDSQITLLADPGSSLEFTTDNGVTTIQLSDKAILNVQWAYVVQISNVLN